MAVTETPFSSSRTADTSTSSIWERVPPVGTKGTPFFRTLQKLGIPFAAGILMENDVDCQAAEMLSDHVIKSPCFEPITPEIIEKAKAVLTGCRYVLDAGTPIGTLNSANNELLCYAEQKHIPVIHDLKEVQADAE